MLYIKRVLLAFDVFVNTLFGGYPDETISYRASLAKSNGAAWGCVLCRVMEWFVPHHCDLSKPPKVLSLVRAPSTIDDGMV